MCTMLRSPPSIGYIDYLTQKLIENTYDYVFLSNNNLSVNLPELIAQTNPITFINLGTRDTIIRDYNNLDVFLLGGRESVVLLPVISLQKWEIISKTSPTLAPLVPNLNAQINNKSGWVAVGSAIADGAGAFSPWNDDNTTSFNPNSATGCFNFISTLNPLQQPFSTNVKAFAFALRVGSDSLTNLTLSGTNDAVTTVQLYSGGPFSSASDTHFIKILENDDNYFGYIFQYTFANLTGCGIRFLQIYGSY